MNKKTYYQIILDASGSMATGYHTTLNTLNEQISMVKHKQSKNEGESYALGISDFSDDLHVMLPMQSPDHAKAITQEDYQLRGMTALWDAIGHTVTQLEAEVGKEVKENRASVVVVVLTDGHENASRHYSARQIQSKIKELEATNLWDFSFIGADLDVDSMADEVGLEYHSRRSFSKSSGVFASRVSSFTSDLLDRQWAVKNNKIDDKADYCFSPESDSDLGDDE